MINHNDVELAQKVVDLLNKDNEQYLISVQTSTFVDELKAGRVGPDQIHDYIEAWHNAERMPLQLYQFLGMTWSDWAHWTATGKILNYYPKEHVRDGIDSAGHPARD